MRYRILVIDDEESLCEILKFNLEKEGYDVDTANSAEEALGMDLSVYNLMIVDIMMDKMSGFDFAKQVKRSPVTEFTPIIFCSALSGEDHTVMGLNIGADDYITKPFVNSEVIARVKAVLRRAGAMQQRAQQMAANQMYQQPQMYPPMQQPVYQQPQPHMQQPMQQPMQHQQSQPQQAQGGGNYESDIVYRGLRISQNDKIVYIDGKPVDLTPREFKIILYFLTHRNRIYSRDEIISEVWDGVEVSARTIDVNMSRLRKKIGEYGDCIHTRPGFGYGFKEQI